jgi:two-component system nitrate/nitrite response regulator NarL
MRIILADPNQKTLWALRTLLDEEAEMEVIGEVVDARQLYAVAEESPPDLVLLDKRLPENGIEALITELHALESKPVVVVMSSDTQDSRYVLNAGADAFVSKGEQPDWLLRVLRHYAERMSVNRGDGRN